MRIKGSKCTNLNLRGRGTEGQASGVTNGLSYGWERKVSTVETQEGSGGAPCVEDSELSHGIQTVLEGNLAKKNVRGEYTVELGVVNKSGNRLLSPWSSWDIHETWRLGDKMLFPVKSLSDNISADD